MYENKTTRQSSIGERNFKRNLKLKIISTYLYHSQASSEELKQFQAFVDNEICGAPENKRTAKC